MNEKLREAKEAKYREANLDVRSVCSGQFCKRNDKTYEQCKNCANCFKYKQYSKKTDDTPEVHFHYIDNFRKCAFYKYRPIDETYIITTVTYNVLYINDLAVSAVVDLKDFLKGGDKETVKLIKVLEKRVRCYERMLGEVVGDKIDFFADFNSAMDDTIAQKARNLKDILVKVFEKMDSEQGKMMGYIEYARTMVGYAVKTVENRIKECLKYRKDVVSLRHYKLDRKYDDNMNYDILSVVENLSRWTSRKCNSINLNKNSHVMDAYSELDLALKDSEIVAEALQRTQKSYD